MPGMDFEHPPADPLPILAGWIEDARQAGLPNPNAMALATIDADGKPSARIVLLKTIDPRGACFFTNYHSRKGRALEANPRAALLFHWDVLDRQARIEGEVTKVSAAESDAYFASRPRESQLGAWASEQSQPIDCRADLELRLAEVTRRYEGGDVPRPPHWGGFRMRLDRVEFWSGDKFRLHDRIVYEPKSGGGWTTKRLCP